ncbi:MAG: nucleotidyltransferase family protein [Treponema sp.]|jgi:molybdenum cofactor cytidylyltransferase|nr:nucleotidyltransferase family protein [Treponema sp.]
MENPASNDTIDAILMASGFSKRFGNVNKLLLPFRGKALARHTLELVCGVPYFQRIFFIAAAEPVMSLAQDLPVRIIRNEHPEQGQGESIRLGVEASDAEYYVFFPCDQPLLDQDTLGKVLEARSTGCIVQPAFQGEGGSPALFSRTFREELLCLQPGESGRLIKQRHPMSIITVELSRPEPLLDIDNQEILEYINQYGASENPEQRITGRK